MTFTSTIFLIGVLPWLLLVYHLFRANKPIKKLLIIAANIVFYVWSGVQSFIFVLIYSVVIWLICLAVRKNKSKPLLIASLIVLIAPLIIAKYCGNLNISGMSIFSAGVPLGISFFTFEAVSFVVDSYSGKLSEKPELLDTFSYLTFFPTVTSGPIIRYNTFASGKNAALDRQKILPAISRIVIGISKTVLIANKLAPMADYYFDGVKLGQSFSAAGLWLGSIAYSLQLYFDFSGYSDVAIGVGSLLGFDIPENFLAPYRATSISDFWKRWHISLSTWFRDYIYIPLGGNRCSIPRHILNLLAVWLVTGIWHGADLSFVIWGLGYFILLVAEKYLPYVKRISGKASGHIYTLLLVNFLWIPFRAANISVAGRYIAGMLCNFSVRPENKALFFIPLILISSLLCVNWKGVVKLKINPAVALVLRRITIAALFVLSLCAIINSTYAPYIYGNF